jgi:Beta-ketoacyl synthase, N-terminal domain
MTQPTSLTIPGPGAGSGPGGGPGLETGPGALHAAAAAAGLSVLSSASWPETEADQKVTPLAGFIDSNFSPLLAEVAGRALSRCDPPSLPGTITAIVMVTALGDVTSAARVAAAVDAGQRVSPLQFFQSVPNAVAGYLAARSHLTGPVVCVSGMAAGLEIAALLIDDADADEALVVGVDLAVPGGWDSAAALLVTGPVDRK